MAHITMQHILTVRISKEIRLAAAAVGLLLAFPWAFPSAPALAQTLPARAPQAPAPLTDDQGQLRSFPASAEREARYVVRVPVTAYSSTPDQTDDTPFITASGSHVRWGIVAANFLPIGTRVRLPDHFGDQVFVVEDRMNARYDKRMDIWMETRDEARSWGIRHVTIEVL